MSYLNIEFPGGLRVDARVGDHLIRSDQPVRSGGEDSAPSPFALFLGSIATCSGIYALRFCESKGISTEGMSIAMDLERDMATGMVTKINLDLKLPEGFPKKYEKAILNSINLCTVKKHLMSPPEIEVVTTY